MLITLGTCCAGSILLWKDPAEPHGFSARVTDSGMCRIMKPKVVKSLQGTHSHMVPKAIGRRCSAHKAYELLQCASHFDMSCAGNILLRTDAARPHGFSAKISDFGMCRIKDMEVQESLQGTYSHMAPEVIEKEEFSEVSSQAFPENSLECSDQLCVTDHLHPPKCMWGPHRTRLYHLLSHGVRGH